MYRTVLVTDAVQERFYFACAELNFYSRGVIRTVGVWSEQTSSCSPRSPCVTLYSTNPHLIE